jgi:hypothetical protein
LNYYIQLSDVELLKIFEEKEKYQPEAIALVSEILAQRNFTDEDEGQARSEINFLLRKKKEQQEKTDNRINRINDFSGIVSSFLYFYYKNELPFIRGNPYPSLLSSVFNMCIILFLNNRKIISHFSIQGQGRIATLGVSLLLSVF